MRKGNDTRRLELRRCARCGEEKPHGRRADSSKPRALCVDCTKEYLREWREANWARRKLRDTWRGMIDRCHNPDRMERWNRAMAKPFAKHKDYGGAGVKVCKRWRDPKTGLAAFAADLGEPPTPLHTLDRRNPHRGYSPSNCRWADPETQAANRKNTRWVEAPDPETGEVLRLSLGAWSRKTGVARGVIARRLDRGWDPARAVTTKTPRLVKEESLPPVPF